MTEDQHAEGESEQHPDVTLNVQMEDEYDQIPDHEAHLSEEARRTKGVVAWMITPSKF